MGPLSAKQHREYLKFSNQEARESKKMENEESRKQELHEIAMIKAAGQTGQALHHKEQLHQYKMGTMAAPPLGKSKVKSPNPLAGTEMFHQGQHMLPFQVADAAAERAKAKTINTDTVPAMLSPGEAVIPAPAAQNPANKPLIQKMVKEGRNKNKLMMHSGGDVPVSSNAYAMGTNAVDPTGTVQVPNMLPMLPTVGPRRRKKGYADGTTDVTQSYNMGSDEVNNVYANGTISIDPSHEGLFTKKANAAGMGVQEYASKVLSAPLGKYDSDTRKQANFAHNAAHWADGTTGISYLDDIQQQEILKQQAIKAAQDAALKNKPVTRQTVAPQPVQPTVGGTVPVPGWAAMAPQVIEEALPRKEDPRPEPVAAVPQPQPVPVTGLSDTVNIPATPGSTSIPIGAFGPPVDENGKYKNGVDITVPEATVAIPPYTAPQPELKDNRPATLVPEVPELTPVARPDDLVSQQKFPEKTEAGNVPLNVPPVASAKPPKEAVLPQIGNKRDVLAPEDDPSNPAYYIKQLKPITKEVAEEVSGEDDATAVEKLKKFFTYKNFKETMGFNNQEIARLAVSYVLGRSMGYDDARALSFAGKQAYEASARRQAQEAADQRQDKMISAQDEKDIRKTAITMAGQYQTGLKADRANAINERRVLNAERAQEWKEAKNDFEREMVMKKFDLAERKLDEQARANDQRYTGVMNRIDLQSKQLDLGYAKIDAGMVKADLDRRQEAVIAGARLDRADAKDLTNRLDSVANHFNTMLAGDVDPKIRAKAIELVNKSGNTPDDYITAMKNATSLLAGNTRHKAPADPNAYKPHWQSYVLPNGNTVQASRRPDGNLDIVTPNGIQVAPSNAAVNKQEKMDNEKAIAAIVEDRAKAIKDIKPEMVGKMKQDAVVLSQKYSQLNPNQFGLALEKTFTNLKERGADMSSDAFSHAFVTSAIVELSPSNSHLFSGTDKDGKSGFLSDRAQVDLGAAYQKLAGANKNDLEGVDAKLKAGWSALTPEQRTQLLDVGNGRREGYSAFSEYAIDMAKPADQRKYKFLKDK